MSPLFSHPPAPDVLQWLSAGRLASRLNRAIRLWVLLSRFYGVGNNWAADLPQPFNYAGVRDRLFAPTHPRSDRLTAEEITSTCADVTCVCHRSAESFMVPVIPKADWEKWKGEIQQIAAWSDRELHDQLQNCPFATVHRTIRDDLKHLGKMGWLQNVGTGSYRCAPPEQWPPLPVSAPPPVEVGEFSERQIWELLRVLESVAFVQPDLELLIQSLWERLAAPHRTGKLTDSPLFKEPQQRIFVHLDYILADATQDRVDTYQQQIEELWCHAEGGAIQFETWVPRDERKTTVTVYPVCLHYARRAKYLSAYGIDPDGHFGWHNFRLDRIVSDRLTVLNWSDDAVPRSLRERWRHGKLPTPQDVERHLKEAWGFNFYLERALLILRFSPKFARWYVDHTQRHETFQAIAYKDLPQLLHQEIEDPLERATILQILKRRSPNDSYYQARIRVGDINVLMRLRDWQSNGEVIAPLVIREQLKEEALQELSNY
jgi:CRISPR-associated protein (TIGR03985 family)